MSLALGDVVPIEPKIVEAKRIAANNLAAASEKFASDMETWAGWFLVAVRSGYEQSVEAAMLEAGVKAWVPMCEKLTVIKPRRRGGRRPRKRRTSIVHEVTFPGYMAVWIVPTIQSWSAITGFEHVLGLVAAHPESLWSNTPSTRLLYAMSPRMMDHIQGLEVELHKKDSAYLWPYEVGEEVRIIDGPFQGFPATVTCYDMNLVVIWLEVELFGRLTPVELLLDQIEKCS